LVPADSVFLRTQLIAAGIGVPTGNATEGRLSAKRESSAVCNDEDVRPESEFDRNE
jgi:hypothetical protein